MWEIRNAHETIHNYIYYNFDDLSPEQRDELIKVKDALFRALNKDEFEDFIEDQRGE
jgi:hypothetical protein